MVKGMSNCFKNILSIPLKISSDSSDVSGTTVVSSERIFAKFKVFLSDSVRFFVINFTQKVKMLQVF